MKKLGGIGLLLFLAGCATQPLPPPPPPSPPPTVIEEPAPVTAGRVTQPPAPAASADITVQGTRTGTSAHLVLTVDWQATDRKMLDDFATGLRPVSSARHIFYTSSIRDGAILISLWDKSQNAAARDLLIELCTVTRGELVEFDLSDANDGSYAITLDPIFVRDFRRKAIGPMVEVLKRRLDTFASAPAHVEVDRSGKVVVDVSGFVDRAALMQMFHPPTQLEFHAVDESVTAGDIAAGHVPPQDLVLENDFDGPARNPIAISRAVLLSGNHIAEVTNGFSAGTDQPMVALVFDEDGTKLLAEFTRKYVGRRMAVVLDDKLITAPLIREAILGGRVEISGKFTNGDAAKLATLLSPGGTPLPLKLESVELH